MPCRTRRQAVRLPRNLAIIYYNMFVNKLFLANLRYSLHQAISRREVDLNHDFQGFNTYKINIEH